MGIALVTGAASGLGQSVAELLAEEGWELLLWDLDEAGLETTERLCSKARCARACVNLSEPAEVEAAFECLVQDGRRPTLIFHAAGVLDVGDLDALTAAACRRDMEVNYFGTMHVLLGARTAMARGGRILCMSSIAGLKGLPEFGAYGASKFAVFGLCEALRGDFERLGIALSVICPPAVDTPMVKNLGAQRPALYDVFPFAKKEKVVRSIIRAIGMRDRFLILGDASSEIFYRANGLMPRIISRVMEGLTQRKRRKAMADAPFLRSH